MIKISIIVPVYNVERYIDRCLKSLVAQTLEEIEIIIVNDNTPDNSMDICYEYAKKDKRIKIYNKTNEGLGFTRNYGIDKAVGEYICFVDSDDYVSNNMCEILYKSAKEYKADIVYGGIYNDDNGKIIEKKCVSKDKIWKGKEQIRKLLLDFIANTPEKKNDTIMEVSVWKALFRRNIFVENNIRFVSEREFISEDIIFDIDFFLKSNCIVAISECIYYYCVNNNSLSKVYRKDRFLMEKKLYFEIIKKLTGVYTETDIELRTDRFLLARARTNAKSIIRNKNRIGKNELDILLLKICNDSDLQEILKRYPIFKLPMKYWLIAMLMKYRILIGLKILLQ